jgi:uncharacterized protein (UPF0335 family)
MGHVKKVDWETLAKDLQEALSKEMKEVERLEEEIARLNDRLEDSFDNTMDSIRGRVNNCAVIRYLENRLFEEIQKNRGRDEELPF